MIKHYLNIILPAAVLTLSACGGGSSSSSSGGAGASPKITSVSCPSATTNQASTCTIQGTDLPTGLLATLGTTSCAEIAGTSTTTRQFSCPASTAGTYDFVVTTAGGVLVANSGSSSVTVSLAAAFLYEALPIEDASRATLLAQLNAEGEKGYKFWGPLNYGTTTYAIFIKDTVKQAAYSYQALSTSTSAISFVTQANAQGANGYRYWGDYYTADSASSAFYENDDSLVTSYTYQAQPKSSSASAFVAQANTQGALGYRYRTSLYFGAVESAVYEKDQARGGVFSYKALAQPTSSADLITQANTEGAAGYRYRGDTVYVDSTSFSTSSIYVKDTSQNTTFAYASLSAPTSATGLVSAFDPEGEKGFVYLSDRAYTSGNISLLVDLSKCSGALCGYANALSQW